MKATRMLTAAVALAATLALAACGGDDGDNEGSGGGGAQRERVENPSGTIRISNWDEYMPEDLVRNFERDTGIKVQVAKHTTNEDIVGKLQAANGGGYDLVFVSGPFVESLAKQGMLAELNKAQIPNVRNLAPEATKLAYDVGNRYSVPYTWGTTGICYRSDKVAEEPTSWNAILDPAPEHVDR